MRRATVLLILAAILLNVAAQAYALPMTEFIRERSTSVATDTALRFAYFAFMLGVAFVEALLFDQLRYGGAWRKRFFGGMRSVREPSAHRAGVGDGAGEKQEGGGGDEKGPHVASRSDGGGGAERLTAASPASTPGEIPVALTDDALSDEEFDAAIDSRRSGMRHLVAEHSLPFFLAFFALLLGNYFLFNWINGGFDSYYSRLGHLVTQLRSADPDQRTKAIMGLSYKRGERVERLLVQRLAQGTEKEKTWAAWALGYRRKLGLPLEPPRAVERGELLLLDRLERGTPRQKAAAAVALARYVKQRGEAVGAQVVPALQKLLEEQVAKGDVPVETVIAMGLLRERSSIKSLGKLLLAEDDTVAAASAWALGRMQNFLAIRPLLAALDEADEKVACAMVRALGTLGHAAQVSKRLVDQFNRKSSGFTCQPLSVTLRPDRRGRQIHDRIHLVGATEQYRVLILRVLGKVGFLDDALPWLRRVSAPGSPYSKKVRRYAREYYERLRAQIDREGINPP